ncbi:MAG: LTA synthase family protein [Edaphocola sp.]
MKSLKIPRTISCLSVVGLFFLAIMGLLRIAFLTFFRAPEGTGSIPLAKVLFMGLRYDARIVAIPVLLLLLLSCFQKTSLFSGQAGYKIYKTAWWLFALLLALFYAFDFGNYAYLNQRLNAGLLGLMANPLTALQMLWQTYHVVPILIGLALGLSVMLWAAKKIYKRCERLPVVGIKPLRMGYGVALLLLCALCVFGRAGQFPLRWSDAFALGNDYASNAALNPFQSFFSSLAFRKAGYDLEKVKENYGLMANYLGIDKPDSSQLNFTRQIAAKNNSTKPNVVIVICESFSGYKSSMYGNPLNTTPFFNGLCNDGIFFDRCFTPSYGTARGVWATITGIPDVTQIRTSSRNPAAVNQHSIMNDFEGYEKYYFIGGSLSWANIRGFLSNSIRGLHLYEQDDYDLPKVDVWGVSDKSLFLSADKTLAAQQKPFIAVIQTADNHRPYTIPESDRTEFKILNPPEDSLHRFGFESADEYNAFRYTDYCYQKFMEAARKSPYFDNTIFVFVGDHGIGGDAGNMFPKAWTSELNSMHVPLLFYGPKLLAPARYSYPASQCDVLPTAAGLAGIAYKNTTLGRDLLSPLVQNDTAKDAAFIFNPDKQTIGVVTKGVFYKEAIDERLAPQWQSIWNNNTIELSTNEQSNYHQFTRGFYETAKYLLLHNKSR